MSAAPSDELDIKTKQIVYHDWESTHYDDKWHISFDERCIEYALGRYLKAVPDGRRYDQVLEVGCGTGFFLLNLAQAGVIGEAHCTDISQGMVDVCVMNGARLGIEVQGRVADAERLPYDDDSFDMVIGHAVVHHLPDLDTAFREFLRVLKPGGRLVIAGEPTRVGDRIANQFKRAARMGVKAVATVLGAERVLADPYSAMPESELQAALLETQVDLHIFSPEDLERLARTAGFDQVRTETEELTANWFGWTTRTVEAMVGFDRLPFRYPLLAYHVWKKLFTFDEKVLSRVVPKGVFYNAILTGTKP